MNFNEYQDFVAGIRLPSADHQYVKDGLIGEVGEIYSLTAKSIRDGAPLDFDTKIKKELGDVMWFVAALATDFGFTLQEIVDSNAAKLRDRLQRGQLQGSGDNR